MGQPREAVPETREVVATDVQRAQSEELEDGSRQRAGKPVRGQVELGQVERERTVRQCLRLAQRRVLLAAVQLVRAQVEAEERRYSERAERLACPQSESARRNLFAF